MYFIRKLSGLVLLFWCAVCWAQVSSPATETDSWIYLDPAQIDSTRFLGPPPDAAATRREIAAMLVMQERGHLSKSGWPRWIMSKVFFALLT